MENQAETLLENVLSGMYKAPTEGTYTPTMVIGLGGAGLKVIRHLKKYLSISDQHAVKLIGIDSDAGENGKYPDLPHLTASEVILLDPVPAVRDLARSEEKLADARHIEKFLPSEFGKLKGLHQAVRGKIETRKGAGQFRRAGKLLFGSNVNNGANINGVISGARNELNGLAAKLTHAIQGIRVDAGTKIFVVSSASGGTGAGTVLDCLALLRSYFNGANDVITLVLLMPGAALDKELTDPPVEKFTTRGNAIGLLRELQALMLGEVKRVFQFDGQTKYVFNAARPLVHDCYLVDNQLADRTPVESWMDMCQAVGYFIYSIVATGVGASHAAGAVNGQIDTTTAGDKEIPPVFNTFGIGVVEYPVAEMTTLAVKFALDDLLNRWCDGKPDRKETEAEIGTTLTELGLADLSTFRGRWDFNPASLPETQYLKGGGAQSAAMHDPDDKFLQGGERAVNGIDGVLAGFEEGLKSRQESLVKEIFDTIDQRARLLMTGNHAVAQAHWTQLERSLEGLKAEHADLQSRRASEQEKYRKDLERLKKKIDFWDFYTDWKFRKQYIVKVNQYLQSRGDSYLDGFVALVLSRAVQRAREMTVQVKNLAESMENTRMENAKSLAELRALEERRRLAFVQRTFPGGDFDAWVRSLKLPVKEKFVARELKERVILGEALLPAMEEIRQTMMSLHLVEDAKKDDKLLQRIKSLNMSSQPVMQVVATGPQESDLIPQKYVAAHHMPGDEFLTGEDLFPKVGQRKVTLIQSSNQHALICLQTRHGLGAAHWAEYEASLSAYRANEWYYGSFAADENIPQLEKVSRERATLLERFGLGLMFEFIVRRGSNYYRNLAFFPQDKAYYFLSYAKAPGPYAQQLLDEKMVQPALQTSSKPLASNLLGESLEAAIEALGLPDKAEFGQQIQDVVEEFIAQVGKAAAQAKVKAYKEALEAEAAAVQDSTSKKDLLAEVVKQLKNYGEKSITAI